MAHLETLNLFPASALRTGAHANSARAVAEGQADFAALDALTWVMLKEHTKLGTALRDVETTIPTPALPYITARSRDAASITRAVRLAINALSPRDRNALHLLDLIEIPTRDYMAVANPSTQAARMHDP